MILKLGYVGIEFFPLGKNLGSRFDSASFCYAGWTYWPIVLPKMCTSHQIILYLVPRLYIFTKWQKSYTRDRETFYHVRPHWTSIEMKKSARVDELINVIVFKITICITCFTFLIPHLIFLIVLVHPVASVL